MIIPDKHLLTVKNCFSCTRRFVVGCMEFDWVMWVVGWVGLWVQSFYSVMGCVGLGWVEEIGPMDNSV